MSRDTLGLVLSHLLMVIIGLVSAHVRVTLLGRRKSTPGAPRAVIPFDEFSRRRRQKEEGRVA